MVEDYSQKEAGALAPAHRRFLAEETVLPISFVVPLIFWLIALFVTVSTAASVRGLEEPNFVLTWIRTVNGVSSTIDVIFLPLLTLALAICFTLVFFMFKGIRYRIFADRIEFQRGKLLCLVPWPKIAFGEWQTLDFSELNSIEWKVRGFGDDNPHDTTFIEFHFASRTLQLHTQFALSSQVAEACRTIERDTIAPRILRSLEDGKTIMFLRPDKFPSHEIEIDKHTIWDWD